MYAHASVGCLHVRPVVNLKTEAGVRQFEAIASASADLVLEFGGALSGEHGDGLVRSPFMEKMFGPVLYDAFRASSGRSTRTASSIPGKIVDAPPIDVEPALRRRLSNAAAGRRSSTTPSHGGMPGAVEMCSGLGACRKTLDGTMCPSYMATRDEAHSTRGRANVLRLAMAGKLGEAGLGDEGVREVLDLCLECRACKAECPVGVDVARFKSEFLADYWRRHGTPLRARVLGHVHRLSRWGSRFAPLSNAVARSAPVRWLNERLLGLDRRRAAAGVDARTVRDAVSAGAAHGARDRRRCFFSTTRSRTTTIPASAWQGWTCSSARHRRRARAECLLRPPADLAGPARSRARQRAESTPIACYPLRPNGPAARVLRAELPLGDARGRSRRCCAATRRPRAGRRDRCVLFEELLEAECQAGRVRLPLSTRAGADPAARPLPSEGDGPSGAGEGAAWTHSRSDGRRSRRRLLRHGRFVRLRSRSLRRVTGDRRASAAAGRARLGRRQRCSSRAASRAGIRSRTSPACARRARRRAPPVAHSGVRMNLAVISVSALVLAVVVSCVSRLNVGVLAVALAWIVGVYIGGIPVNTVMGGFPSQLFLTLTGVTLLFALAQSQRDARAHHAPRRARVPRQPRRHSGHVLRARRGAGVDGSRQHRDGGARSRRWRWPPRRAPASRCF